MRLQVQMDLKERDILEKEVKKELQGIAKGMARQTMTEELEKEINRLVDAKILDARKGEYYSTVIANVTRVVSQRISNDIKLDTEAINDIIEAKVEAYLNNKMKPYGGFDKFVESIVKKSIADLLTAK